MTVTSEAYDGVSFNITISKANANSKEKVMSNVVISTDDLRSELQKADLALTSMECDINRLRRHVMSDAKELAPEVYPRIREQLIRGTAIDMNVHAVIWEHDSACPKSDSN